VNQSYQAWKKSYRVHDKVGKDHARNTIYRWLLTVTPNFRDGFTMSLLLKDVIHAIQHDLSSSAPRTCIDFNILVRDYRIRRVQEMRKARQQQ